MIRGLILGAGLLALAACHRGGHSSEYHADWVIRSRVVFLSADLAHLRPEPPRGSFRLWFPYVIGDLYGAPGTGDFVAASVHPDLTFAIDLNRSRSDLERSLEPTAFDMSYLKIVPAQARIARLAPAALQANGIDRIGTAEWVDLDARVELMLVYADRPAWITGHTIARGTPVRYDVRFPAAGYVWVRIRSSPEEGISYSTVPRPAHLALAVTDAK
ncbi:MAG TPA: hypothetical protein VMU67_11120 [Steroidobacteraceae bacterium]|nr:hypothetical protein [Steroidobacteraceae bacterium]